MQMVIFNTESEADTQQALDYTVHMTGHTDEPYATQTTSWATKRLRLDGKWDYETCPGQDYSGLTVEDYDPDNYAGEDAPVLWTPAERTSALWVHGDASTIELTSSKVSKWIDQSGNGLDLVQTINSRRPDHASVQINAFDTVSFVASSSEDLHTTSNPFGASISNAHVFIVYKCPSTLIGATNFSLSASVTTKWGAHAPWSDGNCYYDVDGDSGVNRIIKTSYATANEILMSSFYCSTTDSVQEIWKNGTLVASDATGHTANTSGNIFLGAVGTTNRNTSMDVAEFLVINGTTTAAERIKIEGYLAHKYGLEGSLPGIHTYKDSAPTV